MNEQGVSRTTILTELQQSRHGKLDEYRPVISQACVTDAEFVAHLIAWDYTQGQIKDSKIALPIISMASRDFPASLVENSIAHLMLQPPRELLKAMEFAMIARVSASRYRMIQKAVRMYLAHREAEPGKWMRLAARHRRSLKRLYALSRATAPAWVSDVLFGFTVPEEDRSKSRMLRDLMAHMRSMPADPSNPALVESGIANMRDEIRSMRVAGKYPAGSIFHDIAHLNKMSPAQVAAAIQKWHLSPLVVSGALSGSKTGAQEDSGVVQAGIAQMSDTELVTRAPSLAAKLKNDAVGKEGFRKRVAGAVGSKKATLKTGHKAEEVEDDSMREMLRELQERQIQAQKAAGRGINGNWLVIGDRSNSQQISIKLGVHVAAALAKFVTGTVHIAFCNDDVSLAFNATGMRMEELTRKTELLIAAGATSYGVGLQWAILNKLELDGVIIVGDGGENWSPFFAERWRWYRTTTGKELAVYFFQTFCEPRFAAAKDGDPAQFEKRMKADGVDFVRHDFRSGQVDYYSIPNIVSQLNVSRFTVMDSIMACPLLTMEQVIPTREAVAR